MLGIDLETAGKNPTLQETKRPELSVVVPIFNEEGTIPHLIERLNKALLEAKLTYEMVFVDDGSNDASFDSLGVYARKDDRLKVVSFSRNFGHQVALTAGLEHAQGSAIVVIDADLQDPPELIPELVAKWKEGFDVVYAIRKSRVGETWFKLLTAKIFYRFIRQMTHFDIPTDTGDFRLMSRRVVKIFLAMPEQQRYIRGMIAWIGFRQTGIFYNREERIDGKTKFTLSKMSRFALDGITSFSYVPLQLASYAGFASALVSFGLMLIGIYQKLFSDVTIKGWTSTVVITLFLGGIQLIMIGVLGEYIGRIHSEIKRRPLYIVKQALNIEKV